MNLYTYDYLEKNGRLGNQLWQIAATINLAEQNDGIARFRPDWEYRKFFSVPNYFFDDPQRSGAERVMTKIDGGTNYFQDFSNFEPIEDMIRSYFKPSQEAVEHMHRFWAYNFDTDADRLCAVHVRRGDYLKHPNHFPIMTQRYFVDAVNDVKSRNESVAFVVFSDDPDWCESNPSHFGFTGDEDVIWHRGTTRPVEVVDRHGDPEDQWDLFAMSRMDEHIISNSTFSWWGAFLSENPEPIYPDRWFGKEVPGGVDWEKAIPSDWRRFSC